MLGYNDTAINGILENIVFLELMRRGYLVYIGKTDDYEIDFVARKNDSLLYIQVSYLLSSPETYERELRPLKSIKDSYPKLVLSMDNLPQSNQDGIVRMNIRDWLIQ